MFAQYFSWLFQEAVILSFQPESRSTVYSNYLYNCRIFIAIICRTFQMGFGVWFFVSLLLVAKAYLNGRSRIYRSTAWLIYWFAIIKWAAFIKLLHRPHAGYPKNQFSLKPIRFSHFKLILTLAAIRCPMRTKIHAETSCRLAFTVRFTVAHKKTVLFSTYSRFNL